MTIINWISLLLWAIIGLYELFFSKKLDKLIFGAMWFCLILQLTGNLLE